MSEAEVIDLKGVVRLRIDKVAELGAESKFSPTVKIAKLPWRLEVLKSAEGQHSPPTLAVYVWSNWTNKSSYWSCKAIVKFIIKSRELDFVRNFEHNFCAKQPFVNWTRLLDPGGNYSSSLRGNREYDDSSLEIEALICVNEIIGYGFPSNEDQIFVNGNIFAVNKFILAAHSPYFRAFFFEDRFRECQTQTFEINDNEVDVEMFGVMLSCIYPDNGKPDDDNVETILQLCDKYDLPVVKERCERFLIEECCKCFVFKFRMAEQYGLCSLKCHCLNSIDTIEFCARLLENIAEFRELSECSKNVVALHLEKVGETEKRKQILAALLQNGLLQRHT